MYYQASKREELLLEEQVVPVETATVEDFTYDLINVVAMGSLTLNESPIDLTKVASVVETRQMNRFPCVLFKIGNISVILFKNGKMILTGIKNPEIIPELKEEIEQVLRTAKIGYSEFSIEIQNLVAMTNLGRRIDLEMACLKLENCLYEPEQFPAAVIKNYLNTRGVFLVFSNSKIICLGTKNLEELDKKFTGIVRDLYQNDLIF